MDYIDIISIKIIINSNDFKIISYVYRSPDYNGNDFINLFHKYISREMYICGDYNINLLNNTVLSNSFKNILIQLGISNIIDMPKLECIGFRGDTNLFIKSYLKNRYIITQIDNTPSSRNIIRYGM